MLKTEDKQMTKGTRVAALYFYSDVIYVLKEFAKYKCGPNSFDPNGSSLLICTTTRGNDCRYPAAVCGNASESTLRKTKFLFCN